MNEQRYQITTAQPSDEAEVRALLREPMPGAVRVALQREPDLSHGDRVEGERHRRFVARDPASGALIGAASRSVRRLWVNGEPRRVGYLSQLRRAGRRGGVRLLRDGYRACEAMRAEDELPFDLTTIIADNHAARRLLERGLPGVPCYTPLCELVTLMIPVRGRLGRAVDLQAGCERRVPEIVECLNRFGARHQFAPVWRTCDLTGPGRLRGLSPKRFHVAVRGDRVVGCVARWDQRGFKQAVVRGYGKPLHWGRWLVNVGLALRGHPALPRAGTTLRITYLSHVAVDEDDPTVMCELLEAARRAATRTRDSDYLVTAFAAGHPLLPMLQERYRPREYRSVLYLVHRLSPEALRERLDSRCPHLEVATL